MGPETRQLRHAQEIRDRRDEERFNREASPEEQMARLIAQEVARQLPMAIATAFATVNITGTNGCVVSGKFPTLTIAMQISLTGSGTCDGNGNMVITINGQ